MPGFLPREPLPVAAYGGLLRRLRAFPLRIVGVFHEIIGRHDAPSCHNLDRFNAVFEGRSNRLAHFIG